MVTPTDPTDTILLLTECFASQPLPSLYHSTTSSQSVIKNQLQAAMDGIGYGRLFRLAMDMGADTTGSCLPKKFGSLAAPTNRAVTGEPLANQHADATPHCIDSFCQISC